MYRYNLLYDHFLKNDHDFLLHFDVTRMFSEYVIEHLEEAINSGYDTSTCLNKFFPNGHLRRGDTLKSTHIIEIFNTPLVGQNSSYDRTEVQRIGDIQCNGVNK